MNFILVTNRIGKLSISGGLSVLLLAFSIVTCVDAADTLPKRTEQIAAITKNLSEYIPGIMNKDDVESISIAVIDKEGILWAKGFGYADKEKKIAATSKTVYRAGSLSMLATSAAVMQLVAKGDINLDKSVEYYLPDFAIKRRAGFDAPITIRHLLTHHSGFPVSIFKGMWTENPISLSQLVSALNQETLAHNPGDIFSYSNLNYAVLGFIVEKVTGMPVEQFVAQSLFKPLNMQHSKMAATIVSEPLLAQGYRKGKLEQQLPVRDYPALGLYTNVEDMGNFISMLLNQGLYNQQSVLKLASVHSLLSPQNNDVPMDFDKRVGFGWQFGGIDLQGVDQVAWRLGATLLFRSRIAVLPKEKLGVIVFSNSSNSFRAVEKITKQALSVTLESVYGIKQVKRDVHSSDVPAIEGMRKEFENAYSTYIGYVPVKKDLKDFRIQLMGWEFRLKPKANGWYTVHYDLLGVIPLDLEWITNTLIAPVEIAGRKLVVAHYEGQNVLFGSALVKPDVPVSWRARLGTYRVINGDAFLKNMKIEQGRLILHNDRMLFEYKLPLWFPLTASIPVKPMGETEAIIPGYGSAMGESIYVIKRDKREVLKYSGYELERISD